VPIDGTDPPTTVTATLHYLKGGRHEKPPLGRRAAGRNPERNGIDDPPEARSRIARGRERSQPRPHRVSAGEGSTEIRDFYHPTSLKRSITRVETLLSDQLVVPGVAIDHTVRNGRPAGRASPRAASILITGNSAPRRVRDHLGAMPPEL